MPVIINEGGVEVEVSVAEKQRLINEVIAEKRPQQLEVHAEAGIKTALWDCIEQQWSAPMPNFDLAHYLAKTVAKCSACSYTSPRATFVPTHIQQVVEGQMSHVDAQVAPIMGSAGFQCSACGVTFISRPSNGLKHLNKVQYDATSHAGAHEIVLKRFSLGPSEPVILEEHTPSGITGSVASQIAQSSVPGVATPRRKRNRRRR